MTQSIQAQRKRLLFFRILTLLIGVGVSVFVYLFIAWQQNDQAIQTVQMAAHQRSINIANEVSARQAAFQSLSAPLQSQLTKEHGRLFDKQASITLRQHTDIDGLYWSPFTPVNKLTTREQEAKSLGIVNYRIHQVAIQNNEKPKSTKIEPATEGKFFLPTILQQQRYQGLETIGLDMLSNPQWRDAILKAIESKAVTSAQAYTVFEENNRTKTLWLFYPVFAEHSQNDALIGLLSMRVNFNELIENSINILSSPPVPVQIYDIGGHTKSPLFHWPEREVFNGLNTSNPTSSSQISLFDKELKVINVATERYLNNFQNSLPFWLALLSLFCSAIVYFTIKIMQGRFEALYDESNQRLWQLEQANKTLNNKVIEKSTFEKSHKDLQERINDYIDLSEDYYWDISTDLRYTYVSRRCANITGYPVTSLIGSSFLDNLHEDDIKLFEEASQKVILRKKNISLELRNLTQNNRWRMERVHFKPVFDKQGECIGFRGISRDLGKVDVEDSPFEDTPLINSAFSGRRLNERISGISFDEEHHQPTDNYLGLVSKFIASHEKTLDKVQTAFVHEQYDIISQYMKVLEKDASALGSSGIVSAAQSLNLAAKNKHSADVLETNINTLENHLNPVLINFKKLSRTADKLTT